MRKRRSGTGLVSSRCATPASASKELCELTHLRICHYQRSNGEVIAPLAIAPSKTDRERIIPMSAELFHVVAPVHTTIVVPNGGTVRLQLLPN
jgi:hypothetical protein